MANEIVNRRGFLSKAIAIGSAAIVPLQLAQANYSKRTEMAKALHSAVSQFSEEHCPTHVQVCNDGHSLNLEMHSLLDSSVEEIEVLLQPLFGGAL